MVITSSGDNIIQLDDDFGYELLTTKGYDYEKVEEFQTQWFQNFEVVSVIRDYHNVLSSSFEEFNLKSVLWFISQAGTYFIEQDIEEKRIQGRISSFMDSQSYSALDSAHYGAAKVKLSGAANLYGQLHDSVYGSMFILSNEESHELMQKTIQ